APLQGTAPRPPRDPGSRGLQAARQGNEPGGSAALRREAPAPPGNRVGPLRLPRGGGGGPAGAARRWQRRGRDHPGRPTGTRPSGRGLGRYGGRGDRPTHPARHELRPESDARACRRGAAAPGAVPQADSGGRGPRGVAHQCALRRAAAPRVRGAGAATAAMKWVALLGVLAVWRLAPLQGGEWTATPATPTVGDTVWLEREIVVPAGWRLRAGKLDATEQAGAPAGAVAGAILAAGLRWRRRAPLTVPPPPPVPLEHEVPDARWLAAGEPKAVAARATYRLRVALARAIPDARLALSTAECLAAVERARP